MLGSLDVSVGVADKFPYQIFDIATDIAGFAKFSRVAFDEWHAEFAGDKADQIGFPDPGRADH